MRATTTTAKRRTRGIASAMVITAVVALSILGGGAAMAANPSWVVGHGTDSFAVPQPLSGASSSAVSAGAEVGFFEWIRNDDTSNISQLSVVGTTTPSATVVGASWTIKNAGGATVGSGLCPAATPLNCAFGALRSGETLYLVAAFTTASGLADGSTQRARFDFNSTGTPGGGNNSHGDSTFVNDEVKVTSNKDAAGDFNFNQLSLTVADNQDVGSKNPQSTSVTIGATAVGAAVGDSPSLQTPCTPALTQGFPSFFSCSLLTSLTSTVEVGNGKIFNNPNGAGTPGIKVLVKFFKAPSQLTGANPFAYHYWEDATGAHAELITTPCALAGGFPTNAGPCLIVGNKQVTVWLLHNGPMKF
jgi:hypothetical protein